MKNTIKTIIFGIISLLLLSTFGHSQVRITPVTSGSNANCGHIIMTVRQLLTQFQHPTKWNIVVACDAEAWHTIQSMAPSTIGRTDYAFSDPATAYSYFNGPTFLSDEDTGRTIPVFMLAHEAAHILTKCKADNAGEKTADAVAERLINHKPYGDLIR